MHTITIALKNTPAVWRLIFKTKEAADKAWQLTAGNTFAIADDYGQVMEANNLDIAGKLFEDVTETNQAAIELTLNNQRIQVEVQKRFESDPKLRMNRGPAVLSPMSGFIGNGRG